MSGYQPFSTLRAHIVSGPPAMPVVDRALVRPEPKPLERAHQRTALSDDKIAEIIRLRSEHRTYRQIHAALGVGAASIRKYAGHIEPPEGGWPNCWQAGNRDRLWHRQGFAQRLRRSGFTWREIAEELGCSRATAFKIVQGTERKKSPKSVVSEAVEIVARVTGVAHAVLRRPSYQRSARSISSVAKARAILFWMLRRTDRCVAVPKISESLGGFDPWTIRLGVRRAQTALDCLGLTPHHQIARTVRQLWVAEWPEAARRA